MTSRTLWPAAWLLCAGRRLWLAARGTEIARWSGSSRLSRPATPALHGRRTIGTARSIDARPAPFGLACAGPLALLLGLATSLLLAQTLLLGLATSALLPLELVSSVATSLLFALTLLLGLTASALLPLELVSCVATFTSAFLLGTTETTTI